MDPDDLDAPSKGPSRVSRFAPKSSKLKPKPKSEPQESVPNTETQGSLSKSEPQELDSVAAKKKEDDEERVAEPSTHATTPKAEPLAPNGTMKMEVNPKSEEEDGGSKQDDPMDEDSAEDTVVREIDVFFSPSIDANAQLYVLQYPLRPCWRPYELDERCEEVRLKPLSSEVEIDLSMDTESHNYDKEFGSRLKMTKQTLSTSWKPPCMKGYAVGLLKDNKLHLHPIHAVVQLRPSLEHINSVASKKKNVISTGVNATVKIEASVEEKSGVPLEKQNKQLDSSNEQNSDGNEYWFPLKYHSSRSDISSKYLQQMVAQDTSPINFTMSPYDYVASLCPGVSNNKISPKHLSKRYLLPLPLEERLKKLLLEGPPLHRFSAIKHFAPEYSEEELLGFMQQHAILVQGLWAPKGALLYPQGGATTLARDYVLLLFSQSLKVQLGTIRSQLEKDVKTFLNIFGEERHEDWKPRERPVVYWKFREHPDESFMKQYPNIVAKSKEVLNSMEQQILGNICKAKNSEPGKTAAAKLSMDIKSGQPVNTNNRTTSAGGVPPGRMTMSNQTRQALPIALKKIFENQNVCSFQMIRQGLQAMAVSKSVRLKAADAKIAADAVKGLEAPAEELQAVISEVAWHINGYYVLKSSQDDPFRDVVIDLLRGSGPNAKLKKAEIIEAARKKLNREVSSTEYCRVMGELCVSKGSAWVLKSDGRIVQ